MLLPTLLLLVVVARKRLAHDRICITVCFAISLAAVGAVVGYGEGEFYNPRISEPSGDEFVQEQSA
jgi:hypothetical protein